MIVADTLTRSDGGQAACRDIPIQLLINRGSGAAAGEGLAAKLETACREARLAAEIRMLAGAQIADAVEAHADRAIIAIGGGDGSVRSAASTLLRLNSKAALAIIPLGTHNHLARQLAIPLDIPGALEVLARGHRQRIDVGQVNESIFLNNASIGIYPELVQSRDEERRRHSIPKWMANILAARAVMHRLRHHRLRVEANGRAQVIRTPLLFVGNNVYSLEAGHIGQRAAMNQGKLSLFALATNGRLSALWFAARSLFGRANLQEDFAAVEITSDVIVSAHAGSIRVALDGEVERLRSPLRFVSLPVALSVITPPEKNRDI
jgi:diacylglycerol kinase family enzyme